MSQMKPQVILQRMLEGVHPMTGEVLPREHLCHEPEVIRALHQAIMALSEKQEAASEKLNRKNGLPNAGRPWTQEESEELIRLYRTGATMQEMCRNLARRERGVKKQLAHLGLWRLPDGAVKTDANAQRAPVGYERAGKIWTDQENDVLRELAGDKWPVEEIARAMHRSEYAIYRHMEKLNIYEDVPGYPVYDEMPAWSEEDGRIMCEMFQRGDTVEAIAQRLGRTAESISARLFYKGMLREAPVSLRFREEPDE